MKDLLGAEETAVSVKAEALIRALQTWVAAHPLVDASAVESLSYTTAFQFPDLDLRRLQLLTRVPLWIYAVDTVTDADDEAAEALLAHVEGHYRHGESLGNAPGPVGQIEAMLLDLENELGEYTRFFDLRAYWLETLELMLSGMVLETQAALRFRERGFGHQLPEFEEYLEYALHSIAVPHYYAACMIALDDARIVDALPALRALAEACGRAIRLANDYRTFRREQREGRVNAVVLRLAEGTTDENEAAKEVLALAYGALDNAEELRSRIVTGTNAEESFMRCARLAVDFYARQDYKAYGQGS